MTGDFVVRTSPARTIFAPLSIPVMEGRFLLISFDAPSKKGGGGKVSLVLAYQSCVPGRVGSAPQPAPAVSASPGRGSQIDSSDFFHCLTPGEGLFLSPPFTAPGFPTCAKGRESF